MKKLILSCLIIYITLLQVQFTQAKSIFNNSEFAARRSTFMEKIPDGVAIIHGAVTPTASVQFYQNNDFFYFSGIEIPNAVLVIDGIHKESVIFFTISETEADGEGIPLDIVRNPKEFTGIEKYFPIERLSGYLIRLSLDKCVFYTPFRPEELMRENTNEKFNVLQNTMTLNLWDGRLTRELQFVKQLREKIPQITVKDCSSLFWEIRKIKSPVEIEQIRKAAQIGVKAHIALIQATKPGATENELAAIFEYVCKKEEAQDLAYDVILMSGKNHAYGHYHEHDRTLKNGDFIILDAGPIYNYYIADISSTFPANGKYSPRQREIYELANGVRNVCLNNYRPGITLKEVGEKVKQYFVEHGYDPANPKFSGTIRFGGYNHSIGMATHDFLGTSFTPDEPLKPGFVFACDINWPYPEEEMGVRIEDNIVITENGCEVLTQGLPRTVQEIEAIMSQK